MNAPLNHVAIFPEAADAPPPAVDNPQARIIKRDKTGGEYAFDIATYGGLTMGANEILSAKILDSARHGRLNGAFTSVQRFFREMPVLNQIDYVKRGRLPFMLFAFIGGTATVLPVRYMERYKGSIVRWVDGLIHGRNNNDPQIELAHREMDEAPQQTWGSLWKARLTTMAAAIGIDALVGDEHAISARLLKNTRFNSYSSMERACTSLSRKVADWLHPETALERARHIDPATPFAIQKGEGALVKWGANLGFLTTLSLTLTALFYLTSKSYATRREIREERKEEQQHPELPTAPLYHADKTPAPSPVTLSGNVPEPTSAAQRPQHRVASIAQHRQGLGSDHAATLEAQR